MIKNILILVIFVLLPLGACSITPVKPAEQSQDIIEGDPHLALDAAIQKGLIRKATHDDTQAWLNAFREKYIRKNLPPPNVDDDISIFDAEFSHTYVVLRSFTFPPGLINENRAIFLVPSGVPQPSGDYGHSEIFDFATLSVEFTAASPRGQRMISR